jgi:hypothetical protein
MRLFYSTLAVILAACASERPAQIGVTADAADADTVCTREYPTGSNIPLTKCRTRAQVETEKAAAAENLRRSQTGGTNAKIGSGGG